MIIDGVHVTVSGLNPDFDEMQAYVDYVNRRVTGVTSIHIAACEDGKVDVSYVAYGQKFERIRRITGYLVGTIDRWNDSKQAEERDRVKHVD